MRQIAAEQDLGAHFCLLEMGRLHCHEQVDQAALAALAAQIAGDGELRHPVVVDSGTLVILDGHHRVRALQQLGCERVPAYLVNYQDPRITVDCWRPESTPVSKEEIVRAGRLGRPFPPKTSRHRFGPLSLGARPVPLTQLGRETPALGRPPVPAAATAAPGRDRGGA